MDTDLLRRITLGEVIDPAWLASLEPAERAATVEALLSDPAGRRWLRALPRMDAELATRLLNHEEDFRVARRDHTLDGIVRTAPLDALAAHAPAISGGPAAPALWTRLASDQPRLVSIASALASGVDATAGEATLYLLALDPLDPYHLGGAARGRIAAAGLRSPDAGVRGLAAEFLAGHDPAELLAEFGALTHDADERVRGIVWDAAFALAHIDAAERATALIVDEDMALAVRRSALSALGQHAPTADIIEVLSYAVLHEDPALAGDAADLLYSLHRHPLVAQAAQASPHPRVRDIAERLLDPLRGSPAAGGSRPGDPTRATDIYEEMIRQLEQRQGD